MIRNDTASNFQLTNPILALNEFGIETDTGKTKIGDGETTWKVLQYSNLVITTATDFQLSNPVLALGVIGIEIITNKSKVGDGVTSWNLLKYSNITTAARHNLLQARLDQILGRGAGQSGYGQGIANYGPPLTSYQVSNLSESNLNSISAVDVNSLYADMLRARVHQVGTIPTEIAQIVADSNTIAENISSFVGNDGVFTPDDDGSKKGIADYEKLMNKIEVDKFLLHSSQEIRESAISSTRSSPWNGIIFHEFTVSFINADHRRHFFNSGSDIRITSIITGAVSSKGQDWTTFLRDGDDVDTVRMNYNSTTNTNNSGGSSIGNYGLSGTYQVIYQKSREGTDSTIYSENIYKISARSAGTASIQFKVEYNDVSTGTFIDPSTGTFVDVNVTGILENKVQLNRAASVYVSVPKPITVTGIGLSTFATPQPIYSLSASSPAVAEGSAVTINLTTANVPNGTEVPYNIQGVTSADIGGAELNGNFQVVNNSASIVINIANDSILKSADSNALTVRLANGSSNVSVNIIDNTPSYSLIASSQSVAEGSAVAFNLTTVNLPNGTLVPYNISGVTSADIRNAPLNGNFQIANNSASIVINIANDFLLTNLDSDAITVSLANGSASATVNIIDSTPIYSLTASSLLVAEGSAVTVNLTTVNLPNGTLVPYNVNGVTSADISGAPLRGSFQVLNNSASIVFNIANDNLLTNLDSNALTVALVNGFASVTVNLIDTTPVYSLTTSSQSVAEGGTVTITLTTANVPNGTVLPYTISGVTTADISGAPLRRNFQILNNSARIVINIANDLLLTNLDSNTLTLRLDNQSTTVSVNIIDTTPAPVYSLTASNSTIYEGFAVTFNLATQNLPLGTQIPYTIRGITSADINQQSLTGNFTINANGVASLTLLTTIDNFEEAETITVSLDNTLVSASVQILDASYALSSSNLNPIEGDTVNITLVTDKVPNGTIVPYTISGVSSTDINIPLTGSFTVSNNQAQVSVTFTLDEVVEPTEQFNLSLNNGKGSITVNVINNMAKIFTSEYNSLRSRIYPVMVLDYGQTIKSTAIIIGEVTTPQWNDLYTDMIRARKHQTNSFTPQSLWASNYNIVQADLTYLSGLMTAIETDIRVLDTVNQASISTIATSSRATGWNSTIDHEFTVTFASAAARTHFFNAGGQIRFNGSVTYTGADSKTLDWKSLLSGMGNIIMNHNQTVSSSGIGTGGIGNSTLSGTYQRLYERTAAVYAANNYRVFGRADSTTVLRFLIQFNDDAVGNVDESVLGTTTSNCVAVTPDGIVSIGGTAYDTVVLAIPTGANINTL